MATAVSLFSVIAGWLQGPLETYYSGESQNYAVCYSIGYGGEYCFQGAPVEWYNASICCPSNTGCCDMSNYQKYMNTTRSLYPTSYTQILKPLLPLFLLSLVNAIISIVLWSYSCCSCCTCRFQILKKTCTSRHIIQSCSILIRFITILIALITVLRFVSNSTIQKLKNYDYPTLPALGDAKIDESSVTEPGVISITVALILDWLSFLLTIVDYYLIRKGK